MAMGSNPSLTPSAGNPTEFVRKAGLREEVSEHGEGASVHGQQALLQGDLSKRSMRQVQLPVEFTAEDFVLNQGLFQEGLAGVPRRSREVEHILARHFLDRELLERNLYLQEEVRKLQDVVRHSKLETADLYSKFGELAKDWAATVKELSALHENQRQEYEEMIKALQKTNDALLKENNEMKKVIQNLNSMKTEFDKQKRLLRLGQVGYQLDILVSEYVFPGENRASKRARYGTKLKSLKSKIQKMQDQKLQEAAKERMNELDEEMFEDWFLGMVDDMKKVRVDTAHPDLGTYEDMVEVIKHECKEDDDKRDDMLVALKRLEQMYQLVGRPFGK